MTKQIDSQDNRSQTTVAFPHAVPNLQTTVEKLEVVERDVVLSLSAQTDDEILDTRRRSKLAGRFAWRIEVACDAQIVSRATNMRGRRTGTSIIGRIAAVRRRAKEIGCTPNTVFQNSRIFNLIQDVESSNRTNNENISKLQSLDEKGFFIAALTAVDPLSTLLLFAQKKAELKRFRVSDAFRLLENQGLTKKIASTRAISTIRESTDSLSCRASELEHIRSTIQKIRTEVIVGCTSQGIVRIHEAYIEELKSYMEDYLFDEDVATAIRNAWDLGNHREDQMARATGFPLEVVAREMGLLSGLDEFIKVPGTQKWHKVGKPLPPELRGQQQTINR